VSKATAYDLPSRTRSRHACRTAHGGNLKTRATLYAAAALAAAATLSGFSSSEDRASPPPSFSAGERSYTIDDCKELLEQDYAEDNVHDASNEAPCLGLSHDEYLDAAADVIAGLLDVTVNDPTIDTAEMAQYLYAASADEGAVPHSERAPPRNPASRLGRSVDGGINPLFGATAARALEGRRG